MISTAQHSSNKSLFCLGHWGQVLGVIVTSLTLFLALLLTLLLGTLIAPNQGCAAPPLSSPKKHTALPTGTSGKNPLQEEQGLIIFLAGPADSQDSNSPDPNKMASSNRPSHRVNAHLFTAPASTQKIITGLLALAVLGPDFTYTTYLFSDPVTQDTLLKFTGDPTLTFENLTTLLSPFANTTLPGDFVIDVSTYRNQPTLGTWMTYETRTKTGRPVGSFCLDRNYLVLTITPTTEGRPAEVHLSLPDPLVPGVHGENDVTIGATSRPNAEVACLDQNFQVMTGTTTEIYTTWEGATLNVSGTIAAKASPHRITLAPPDLDLYAKLRVTCALNTRNIRFKNGHGVRVATLAPTTQSTLNLLASHTSVPLEKFMSPAMKASDNHVFDTLFITLMYAGASKPLIPNPLTGLVAWEEGNTAFHAYLNDHFPLQKSQSQQKGAKTIFDGAYFADGSGLSRVNRLKPEMLYHLLHQARDKAYFPQFLASLPAPNEPDSTLANRQDLPPTIRAKTGALIGLRALAGYMVKPHGTKIKSEELHVMAPKDAASLIDGIFVLILSNFLPGSSWPNLQQAKTLRRF